MWFRIMRSHEYNALRLRRYNEHMNTWKRSASGTARRFQCELGDGHCGPRSVLRQLLPQLVAGSSKATPEQIQECRDVLAHVLRTHIDDMMEFTGASEFEGANFQRERNATLRHAEDVQFVNCS